MPADDERPSSDPSIELFVGEPPRELGHWRWLWDGDHGFPIRSHRGLLGRLIVLLKKLLRPLVKFPQNDLWERQRVFNLILLEHLQRSRDQEASLETRIEGLRQDLERRLADHEARLDHLERFFREGLAEVMEHDDALFSRVDQKLDRYRRESRQLWARLGSALALAETAGPGALARARDEHEYLELEGRYRGTPGEIAARLSVYLPYLAGHEPVLDLGCGRGEALAILAEHGLEARGVDSSSQMVAACQARDLEAEEGDLFAVLAAQAPESLGAVISFHVLEHLAPGSLPKLARLAWRALRPGGLVVLETPNPLSLVVAACNFWLDPTHVRPVHPGALELVLQAAGFEAIERLELRPFPVEERLPEIPLAELGSEDRRLADRVNRLRDRLDTLLYGCQDYGMVARKPESIDGGAG